MRYYNYCTQLVNAYLKFIHHLANPTSFLSNDVAMKLKRNFHLNGNRNQSLKTNKIEHAQMAPTLFFFLNMVKWITSRLYNCTSFTTIFHLPPPWCQSLPIQHITHRMDSLLWRCKNNTNVTNEPCRTLPVKCISDYMLIETVKNLYCFQSGITALFTARNYNHVTLFRYVWIQSLLQFPICFSILLNSHVSRRCCRGGELYFYR